MNVLLQSVCDSLPVAYGAREIPRCACDSLGYMRLIFQKGSTGLLLMGQTF